MTGEKSTREKAQAVFFSLIMVLSMVAIGAAGFAGTASAIDGTDSAVVDGSINANPANATQGNVSHTIVLGLDEDVAISQNDNLTVNYSDLSNVQPYGGISTSNVSVEHISGGSHNDTVFSDSQVESNISVVSGDLQIELNKSITASSGDIIRVNITDDIEHTGTSGGQVGVTLNGNVTKDYSPTLEVGSDAPIQVNDGDGGNFTSLFSATTAADSTNDVISLSGDVNEFLSHPENITSSNDGLSSATVQNNQVEIQGNNNEAVFDSNSGTYIDYGDNDQVNVTEITLTKGDTITDTSGVTAISTGGTSDSEISTVTTNGFNSTAINVASANGNGIDITNVELNGVGDGTGIDIGSIADGASANLSTVTVAIGSSGSGVVINDGTSDSDVDIDDITIESDVAGGTGISLENTFGVGDIDIETGSVDNVSTGIDTGQNNNLVASNLSISDITFTNIGSDAIDLTDDDNEVTVTNNTDIQISVESSLGATGVNINDKVNATVDQSTFTDTDVGIEVGPDAGQNVTLIDNTVTNATTAVNVTGTTTGSLTLDAHFNTFEESNDAVNITDTSSGPVINLQFNDFVDNSNNALNVSGGGDPVNATYSYWGQAGGPGGDVDGNSVVAGGNIVTPYGSSDVTFTPFLTESVSTLDQNSSFYLGIPDATNPYAQSGAANVSTAQATENATIAVVVLNDTTASGITDTTINLNDDAVDDANIDSSSPSGDEVKTSGITQNVSANVTGDVTFRAFGDGDAPPTSFTQTFSEDVASVDVELNRSSLPAGETALATLTLRDADGDRINHTGTSVGFSIDGTTSSVTQDAITRNGQAKVAFSTDTPDQEITVTGFERRNGESASASIGAESGAVSAAESELLLDGSSTSAGAGNADKTGAQAGAQFDLDAIIRDGSTNPLEGVTVSFDQNTTATIADDQLTTNADGVVNTTVTVPENASVDTQISVSAGDFNPENTSNATANVTTQAAAPDQLGFAADNVVVPAGENTDVEVQILDEFGNFNDTVQSGEIDLSSDDTSVIEVTSDAQSVSDGSATFTVNATGSSGSVNLTATRSGVSDATTEATIGTPQDIQITVDNSSIASGVDNATDVTDVTAQLVDANGNAIGVSSSDLRFTRESGSAASVSSSSVNASNATGAAAFEATATSQTGETTFEVSSPEFGVSNTTTITTTGAPDTITFEQNVTSPAANDTVDVTVAIEDSEGRVVPVTASNYFDMSVLPTSEVGSLVESDTTRDATDGEASVNVTSNQSGDVFVNAFISTEALSDDTTITFTEDADSGTGDADLARFDDGDGTIDRDEAFDAIVAFNTGSTIGGEEVTRDQAFQVIVAFNTGESVDA